MKLLKDITMKKVKVFPIIGLLLTSTFFSACSQKQVPIESKKTPLETKKVLSEPDDTFILKGTTQTTKDSFDIFSGSKAGFLLSKHLKTSVDYAPGIARREMLSLNKLKRQNKELKQQMVSELFAAYTRQKKENYEMRWLIVDLLAQLEINESVKILTSLTVNKIPKETLKHEHHRSSTDEEVAIRLASMRGLVSIASNGNINAEKNLIKIAKSSPITAIKIQAIYGYLMVPLKKSKITNVKKYRTSSIYKTRLKKLKKLLPEEIIKLVDVKPASKKYMPVPEDVLNSIKTPDMKKENHTTSQPPRVVKIIK